MKPLSMYFTSAAAGTFSVIFLLAGGRYASEIIPEWVGQLTWAALVIAGSAVCGYLLPEKPWRWGAMVIGIQPVMAAAILYAVGELENPSSPIGGIGALFIFMIIALMISPIPVFASYLGAAIKKRFLPFLFRG